MPQPTILVISQVYVPDPASVGQHMAEAAAEMAARGFRVITFASREAYEEPRCRYAARETLDGVEVRRLPLSHFGKRSLVHRVLGAASFLVQVIVRGLLLPRVDAILVSTSPPMCSLAAMLLAAVRRVPITYWAMDINPDQAMLLNLVRPTALAVRLFNILNRQILRRAARVVTLDHFMAERLESKQPLGARLAIIPPWPLDQPPAAGSRRENPFRRAHGLGDRFVLMYSGNMSAAHPLDTLLEATRALRDRKDLVFVFVGGGLGQRKVQDFIDRQRPENVILLPYQPLAELGNSLSAADVHVVSMGENMVGVVHPCKAYGAMACSRPLLLLGPRASHVGELIQRHALGWQVDHGDVQGMVATIRTILASEPVELRRMGRRGRRLIDSVMNRAITCGRFCDAIESTLPPGLRSARAQADVGVRPAAVAASTLPAESLWIVGDDRFLTLPLRRAVWQAVRDRLPPERDLPRWLVRPADARQRLARNAPRTLLVALPPVGETYDLAADDPTRELIEQACRAGTRCVVLVDHVCTHASNPSRNFGNAAARLAHLHAVARTHAVRCVGLLAENVFGPRADVHRASGGFIPAVIRDLILARDLHRSRIELPWPADAQAAFVYVRDLARLAVHAAADPQACHLLRVQSRSPQTLATLGEWIAHLAGFQGTLHFLEAAGAEAQPTPSADWQELDWESVLPDPTPLRDALIASVAWFERNLPTQLTEEMNHGATAHTEEIAAATGIESR